MGSNAHGQEKALLRRELVRARKVIDAALEGWAESERVLNGERQRLAKKIDQARETIKDREARLKDARRRLAAHENRSSPSSKAADFSGKRRKRGNRSPPP